MLKKHYINKGLSIVLIIAITIVSMYVPKVVEKRQVGADLENINQYESVQVSTMSGLKVERLKAYANTENKNSAPRKEIEEQVKEVSNCVADLKEAVAKEVKEAEIYADDNNLVNVSERIAEYKKETTDKILEIENQVKLVKEQSDNPSVSDSDLSSSYSELLETIQEVTENESIETEVPDTPHGIADAYDVRTGVGKQLPVSKIYTDNKITKIKTLEENQEKDEALILSEEMKKVADTLDTPVDIYEYVKNAIDFRPYYGLRYGAKGTFAQKAGNDYDTASLLIALLRYKGYEAKYVVGTVQIDIDRAANWVGADNADGAVDILAMLGIPTSKIVENGEITAVRIEHVWVEAKIPYDNYRGSGKVEGAGTWIPLDASFKQYEVCEKKDIKNIFKAEIENLSSVLKEKAGGEIYQNIIDIESAVTEYAKENDITKADVDALFGNI